MSLYNKTKEELCSYMVTNFNISGEVMKKIINELIDGEVLVELNLQKKI